MAEGDQLEELIKRSFKFQDILLFKVLRNIAHFAPLTHDIFEPFMLDMARLSMEAAENTDLQIEVLGTLVQLHNDNWEEVLKDGVFIEFLHNNLVQGYAEDDIMLESIMLIGTICRSEPIAELVSASYIIGMLHNLLG
jgi:hypothetical protein